MSSPPDETPLIRTIAMPADANPNGDIFGGWLMAQINDLRRFGGKKYRLGNYKREKSVRDATLS